jgi:hypothetical protein
MLSVAFTMVSLFVDPFTSAFIFSSLLVFSSLPSAAAYQCHIDDNAKCPGICCQPQDPYQLLVGPTCHIQAVWFSSENGTWVWTFPTFRFSYYWDQECVIMGGEESKPKKEEETTEVLTMHPSWESHVNEETNSGIFFSLLNIHISCALGTLIFCLCIMICILLGYLGYRRFCHRPKGKSRDPPPTCATYSSCTAPPTASRPWDREDMNMTIEDKYYASLRQQDDLDDYGSFYGFAPQPQPQPRRYDQQQPRYDNRQRYNGGQIVDPVEQLRLLLQAVPVANALVQPAIIYQAPPLAQVHQAPPLAPVLSLGATANNANAAANAAANPAPP